MKNIILFLSVLTLIIGSAFVLNADTEKASQYDNLLNVSEVSENSTVTVNGPHDGYRVRVSLDPNTPSIRNPWKLLTFSIPENYDVTVRDLSYILPDGVVLGTITIENGKILIPIQTVSSGANLEIIVRGDYESTTPHNSSHTVNIELLNDQEGTDEFGDSNAIIATDSVTTKVLNPYTTSVATSMSSSSYYVNSSPDRQQNVSASFGGTEKVPTGIRLYAMLTGPYTIVDASPNYQIDENGYIYWDDFTEEELESRRISRYVRYKFTEEDYPENLRITSSAKVTYDDNLLASRTGSSFYVFAADTEVPPVIENTVVDKVSSSTDSIVNGSSEIKYTFDRINFGGSERIKLLKFTDPIATGLTVTSIFPGEYSDGQIPKIIISYKDGSPDLELNQSELYAVPEDQQSNIKSVSYELVDFSLPFSATTDPYVMSGIEPGYIGEITNNLEIELNYLTNGIYPFYCPEGYDESTVSSPGGTNATCKKTQSDTINVSDNYIVVSESRYETGFMYEAGENDFAYKNDSISVNYTLNNSSAALQTALVDTIVVDYAQAVEYLSTTITGATVTDYKPGDIDNQLDYEGYVVIKFDKPQEIAIGDKFEYKINYVVKSGEYNVSDDTVYYYFNNNLVLNNSGKEVRIYEPTNFNKDDEISETGSENPDADLVFPGEQEYSFNRPHYNVSTEVTDVIKMYLPEELIEKKVDYNTQITYKSTLENPILMHESSEKTNPTISNPTLRVVIPDGTSLVENSLKLYDSSGNELNVDYTLQTVNERQFYIKDINVDIDRDDYITYEYKAEVHPGITSGFKSAYTSINKIDNPYKEVSEFTNEEAYVENLNALSIKKEVVQTEVEAGGQITYNVNVLNKGTSYINSVDLEDILAEIGDEFGSSEDVTLVKTNLVTAGYTTKYELEDGTLTSLLAGNNDKVKSIHLISTSRKAPYSEIDLQLIVTTHNDAKEGSVVNSAANINFDVIAVDNSVEDSSDITSNVTSTLITRNNSAYIGDFAYIDYNRDGTYNDGDVQLDNMLIDIYDDSGQLVSTTVTNNGGQYAFTNLPAGTYTVKPYGNSKYTPVDENGNQIYSNGIEVVVGQGEKNTDIDFRYLTTRIDGILYNDSNKNGLYEDHEMPYENEVTVSLSDTNGNLVAEYITDPTLDQEEASRYYFDDLNYGDYIITVSDQYTTYSYYYTTPPTPGYSTSTINYEQYYESNFARATQYDVNFGLALPADISGNVFEDLQKNGVMDTNYMLSHVKITAVKDDDESITRVVQTDEFGHYDLDVIPGYYTLSVELLDNYRYSPTQNDNIADENGVIASVKAEESTPVNDQNFGQVPLVKISGILYEDVNLSNAYEFNEDTLITSREIQVLNGEDVVAVTTTNSDGYYEVTHLEPDLEYIVKFTKAEDEEFISPNVDGEYNVGMTTTTNRFFEQINGSVYRLSDISGKVVLDKDNNKFFSNSDKPLKDIELTLYDENDQEVEVLKTDQSGNYNFTVSPGVYYVKVDKDDYLEVQSFVGEENVSFKFTNGRSQEFTIVSGTDYENINVGLTEPEILSETGFNNVIYIGMLTVFAVFLTFIRKQTN